MIKANEETGKTGFKFIDDEPTGQLVVIHTQSGNFEGTFVGIFAESFLLVDGNNIHIVQMSAVEGFTIEFAPREWIVEIESYISQNGSE